MVRWVVTCCISTGFSRNCLYHSSRPQTGCFRPTIGVPRPNLLGRVGQPPACDRFSAYDLTQRRNPPKLPRRIGLREQRGSHRHHGGPRRQYQRRGFQRDACDCHQHGLGPACARHRRTPSIPIGRLFVSFVVVANTGPIEKSSAGCFRIPGTIVSVPPNVPTIRSGPTSRRASAGDTSPASTCTPSNSSRSIRSARSSRMSPTRPAGIAFLSTAASPSSSASRTPSCFGISVRDSRSCQRFTQPLEKLLTTLHRNPRRIENRINPRKHLHMNSLYRRQKWPHSLQCGHSSP